MITRNEKAKGLWWRLLATLPVLALLLIANTKVTAQEKKADDQSIAIETGQFVIHDDDGAPILLSDTVIYNEDGSYGKFMTSDAFDPITGEPSKKLSITTHDADGTTTGKITDRFLRKNNDTIYQTVDEMPQFPGGEQALINYIAENVKYPEDAKDKNQSGRVMISFVVEKDGSVNDVKVLRGVCESIDNEALRVVKAMPKWKPGKQAGKPVRVSYCLPISFKLSDSETGTPVKKSDMKSDNNEVYQTVEEMPEFPGGVEAMMDYVAKSVVYPQEAMDKEISGRVLVSFVVEKDGSISNVQVLRGIGGGCDEEAVRVVKAMPKWKPGKDKGQPVRVSFTMPFVFKLQ